MTLFFVLVVLALLFGYALIAPTIGRSNHWHTALGIFFGFSLFSVAKTTLSKPEIGMYYIVPTLVSLIVTVFYALWCVCWQYLYNRRHREEPTSESTPQGA